MCICGHKKRISLRSNPFFAYPNCHLKCSRRSHLPNRMNRKSFLKFRVTPLEKLVIKKKAENSGLSMSEFARASVLGQKVSSKLTEDEIEIYKDLVKFHNNFQSISNAMKERSPSISNEVLLLADEMKKHLKKFQ